MLAAGKADWLLLTLIGLQKVNLNVQNVKADLTTQDNVDGLKKITKINTEK